MTDLPIQRRRRRLSPEARRSQILDSAAQLLIDQGVLPIPPEALARHLGVGRPLIYSYFPRQADLFNALLRRALDSVLAPLAAAADLPKALDCARQCAEAYFEHVAEQGPLLHILFSDPYAFRQLEPGLLQARSALVRRLASRLRIETGLPTRDVLGSLNLLLALAEEAGILAFRGQIDRALGRQLSGALVVGALEELGRLSAESRSRAA